MKSEALIASSVLFSAIAVAITIGLLTAKLRLKVLRADTYIVAGRALGTLVFFLNTAAVIYSGYTFLGLAGYSHKYGAAAIYAWGSSLLGYALGYILAPKIWRIAKENNLLTLADFFIWRYGSKSLMILAALVAVAFQIPYVQLQIQSVSILIDVASYGTLPSLHISIIVFILTILYVFFGGMISVAITNVFFGALMLFTMFGGSWAIILKYFGGLQGLYEAIASISPTHLTLPGPKGLRPESWFISTLIGTGIGFWCWSQRVQTLFTAKSDKVIKRGMVLNSWYLVLGSIWVTHMGLAALALGTQLKTSDYAFVALVEQAFGPLVLGLVAAGGAAASLSTAAGLLLDQASNISRNLIQRTFGGRIGDKELVWLTRMFVIIIGATSTILAYTSPALLVDLLLLGYAGVTQLSPGLFVGSLWRDLGKWEVLSGLVAGELVVVAMYATTRSQEPFTVHLIIWGLVANITVLLATRALRKVSRKASV